MITHKAGWIIIDPWTVLQNGFIQADSGKIKFFGRGRPPLDYETIIDHGPGVLMPALVNVHSHLELSALKDTTVTHRGFLPWVQSVIAQRDRIGKDFLMSAAAKGQAAMLQSGTAWIGEVSTLGITRNLFLQSKLHGVWFQEYIGFSDEIGSCTHVSLLQKISFSGHAPHTTSPFLLTKLKQETRRLHLPFSIHLSESHQEVGFLKTGKGPWAEFLSERGIDFRPWPFGYENPVQYADSLGILDDLTIAVHLVWASSKEFEILSQKNVHVCLCPKSNMTLHGRLPDVRGMMAAGLKPCLGTDSLASNDSLNLFDEIKLISENFPEISPELILAMATTHGASALGLDAIAGSLHMGKHADLIYAPVDAHNASALLENLVNANFNDTIRLIHHDATLSESRLCRPDPVYKC